MIRAEREQIIARFMQGDMTSTEEQEFFIQAALDGELRDELKAHRIIEESTRDFRNREHGQHTALRERTVAMLALYPVEQAPEPKPILSAWDPFSQATQPLLSRSSVWVALILGLMAITAGTFLFSPRSNRSVPPSTSGTNVPSVQTPKEPSAPAVESIPLPQSREVKSSPANETQHKEQLENTTERRERASSRPLRASTQLKNTDNELGSDHEQRRDRRSQKGDSLRIGIDVNIDPIENHK